MYLYICKIHIFIYSYIHVTVTLKRNHLRQFGRCMVSLCWTLLGFELPMYDSSATRGFLLCARWWNECPWWACWDFSVNTSQKSLWLSNWTKLSTSCVEVKVAGGRAKVEGKTPPPKPFSNILEVKKHTSPNSECVFRFWWRVACLNWTGFWKTLVKPVIVKTSVVGEKPCAARAHWLATRKFKVMFPRQMTGS